ncbi:MAG: GntR family transcriptional regulator [Lachnospiraceae bacterium]|jgi:DNA-binding FadR family transcriptional regulator|nr:GntR family transcriptional regulator [Lachnospiraceae bacterium]
MKKEEKSSLSEIATDHIRKQILNGALPPGEKIVEFELSSELGMSRGPIREATTRWYHDAQRGVTGSWRTGSRAAGDME